MSHHQAPTVLGGGRAEGINNLPSLEIPYADVPIATAADHDVFPRHHGPNAHHMALQCTLIISIGIKNVNLGII